MTGTWPTPDPRVLIELERHVPGWVLIGSYARDYWVHAVAGMPLVADTLDVDVAVLVGSMAQYRARLRDLDGPTGTGIVFDVAGHQVDVIPYGDLAQDGIVETVPGITMDVSGMAEAVATAVQVRVGETIGRVPTLASMLGLKVVAWGYRHDTTEKDARDLGPLLDATQRGPFHDELWADDDACARWQYDPALVGPYRAGLELNTTWEGPARDRLLSHLEPSSRAELAARVARHGRTDDVRLRNAQLEALAVGAERGRG